MKKPNKMTDAELNKRGTAIRSMISWKKPKTAAQKRKKAELEREDGALYDEWKRREIKKHKKLTDK